MANHCPLFFTAFTFVGLILVIVGCATPLFVYSPSIGSSSSSTFGSSETTSCPLFNGPCTVTAGGMTVTVSSTNDAMAPCTLGGARTCAVFAAILAGIAFLKGVLYSCQRNQLLRIRFYVWGCGCSAISASILCSSSVINQWSALGCKFTSDELTHMVNVSGIVLIVGGGFLFWSGVGMLCSWCCGCCGAPAVSRVYSSPAVYVPVMVQPALGSPMNNGVYGGIAAQPAQGACAAPVYPYPQPGYPAAAAPQPQAPAYGQPTYGYTQPTPSPYAPAPPAQQQPAYGQPVYGQPGYYAPSNQPPAGYGR